MKYSVKLSDQVGTRIDVEADSVEVDEDGNLVFADAGLVNSRDWVYAFRKYSLV